MKLLQVMLSSQNGGAETFFEKLTLALADLGLEQMVIIEPDKRREALFSNHPNITVKTIRFRGIYEPLGRFLLNRCFKKWSPDVAMTWMSRAIKRTPTGYCPIVARLGGYYKVDRYRKSDKLIGNTPDIVQYLKNEGIPPHKTQCIANFGEITECELTDVEAKEKLRSELQIPSDHTILLALGRLHKAKAHDTLIKALKQTQKCSLIIAGEGELKEELESLAAELGLSGNVHLVGWRRDTSFLFKASDMCVFPSRFEPFGNVVVESWAQKKPLITTNSTGPLWLTTNEMNALVVPIDNPEELARAINRLQQDPELANMLIEQGHRTFQSQYSKTAICSQYIDMLSEVTKNYRS